MLNRAALILIYKQPAVDWINAADPYDIGYQATLADTNFDKKVYLISEQSAEDVEHWIRLNYLELFKSELDSWYQDSALWPEKLTYTLFQSWFDYACHSMIIDTVSEESLLDDEEGEATLPKEQDVDEVELFDRNKTTIH